MEKYTKICPICGNNIEFKTIYGYNYSLKKDWKCRQCYLNEMKPWNKGKKGCQIPWNKGITKKNDNRLSKNTKYSNINKPYKKLCSQCGKEIEYKNKYTYIYSVKNNKLCISCSNGNNHRKKQNRAASIRMKNNNPMKNPEVRKKLRNTIIKKIINKYGAIQPNYNPIACKLIDEYGKKHGYNFQHALNGGEYYIKELGYWVDGYDKEKNVVIEYYENHHFTGGVLKDKEINRKKEIINFLKCDFIELHYYNYIV